MNEDALNKREEPLFGLNAQIIKLIAYVAMVLDHTAYLFLPKTSVPYLIFRMLGRIAAPVMCFFIAEGYRHTHDLKKYMGRLAIMAVVSHFPYVLCFGYSRIWAFWRATSVIWSLLMGLIALTLFERVHWEGHPVLGWCLKIVCVLFCAALSYSADWNYIAVIWVLAFGLLHDVKAGWILAFLLGAACYFLQCWRSGLLLRWFPFGIVLFIPLILLYNGKLGKKSKAIQWAAYWFYPAHLMILWIVWMVTVGKK